MGLRKCSAAGARGRLDWRLVDRRVLPALTVVSMVYDHNGLILWSTLYSGSSIVDYISLTLLYKIYNP